MLHSLWKNWRNDPKFHQLGFINFWTNWLLESQKNISGLSFACLEIFVAIISPVSNDFQFVIYKTKVVFILNMKTAIYRYDPHWRKIEKWTEFLSENVQRKWSVRVHPKNFLKNIRNILHLTYTDWGKFWKSHICVALLQNLLLRK